MNKKIMIVVLGITLFQPILADNVASLFDDNQKVSFEVTEAKEQKLSVWAALKIAPRYIHEQYIKPGYKAVVAALFKKKK